MLSKLASGDVPAQSGSDVLLAACRINILSWACDRTKAGSIPMILFQPPHYHVVPRDGALR